MTPPKIVVIVGPTASGKTSLSVELAKKYNGEIISADSRQVYRGLDLGTGKVTTEEMQSIPHHMLDVADPKTVYTVHDFVRDGTHALSEIIKRNHLPIIAGGSFFYVDALLGRVSLPQVSPDETLRAELDCMSTEALYQYLIAHDPRRGASIDKDNRRRLIRAIEITSKLGSVPLPFTASPFNALMLGIATQKEVLHGNIHTRIIDRINRGMIEEVQKLHEHGLSYERLESLGLEYRYIGRYLRGELSYASMLTTLETKIRQFAKRQMTWLKRDTSIVWVKKDDTPVIETMMQNFLKS